MPVEHFDVAIVGVGYVGLMLAYAAVYGGLRVVGYDIDPAVVERVSAATDRVHDLSTDDLRAMAARGFQITADPAVLASAATIVICAPTPLAPDGRPDLTAVRAASATVGERLRAGRLVVLESTSFPGTTEEVVRPCLEQASGLVAGQSFHLAFSSERIDPGNRRVRLIDTPKVVGGVTPACGAAAGAFYRRFVHQVVLARGTREAELSKIIENTYRQVNIALANEFARLAHELRIDVWDAINCAATKPFGFEPFYPGAGPGGHCIPVDPNYFAYKVRIHGETFRLADLAQEINKEMPLYVVERAVRILNDEKKAVNGSTVLLLGVTYKPNVADQRSAPAEPVARALRRLGAAVVYHDPFVSSWMVDDCEVPHLRDIDAAVRSADLTILVQDHACYDHTALASKARLFFDTCGRVRGLSAETARVL